MDERSLLHGSNQRTTTRHGSKNAAVRVMGEQQAIDNLIDR
jgi:hypothetical protein